jgi:O-acetylserine/cysteine efflux transporter
MKVIHSFYATLIAAIWGLSFIIGAIAMRDCPPMLLLALRFIIVFVVGMMFLPKPVMPIRVYIVTGLCLGVIQFAGQFWAIRLGLPAGIASVLAQMNVFITIILATFVLSETRPLLQLCMILVGFVGVCMLVYARYRAALPLLPVAFVLVGALAFSWASIEFKRAGKIDMRSFVVWMSAVPPIPLLLLSFTLEGSPVQAWNTIMHFSMNGVLSLLFLALVSSFFCLVMWGKLFSLYPASLVAPFSLLSPIFGMVGGSILLHERYDTLSIAASILIVVALAVNTFSDRIKHALEKKTGQGLVTSKT